MPHESKDNEPNRRFQGSIPFSCKTCGEPCVLRGGQFYYWDGTYFSGYVCVPCNALYENPDDSIFAHAKADLKRGLYD